MHSIININGNLSQEKFISTLHKKIKNRCLNVGYSFLKFSILTGNPHGIICDASSFYELN
jgi:hypothetical protein